MRQTPLAAVTDAVVQEQRHWLPWLPMQPTRTWPQVLRRLRELMKKAADVQQGLREPVLHEVVECQLALTA